ncbi:hypothetical protein D9757_012801 [Collybiopsis confluens]|uniref:Cytochrome P450 n=1 Tax=Collybiopsis confluens TaxID=2823264 RepID=A0A8H5GJE5_9AGAR|nr:hypothetical protein D9757_012801 [Collybiopsis confluens]
MAFEVLDSFSAVRFTQSIWDLLQRNVTLVTVATVICSLVSLGRYVNSPWRRLPPGPRGLPFLGNALDLSQHQWLKFTEWRKDYGEIVYVSALGQPIIVLNSKKVAADLLDRRAAIYSDRPRNIVASEIMTNGLLIVFSRHGDIWRRMRKAAHEALNKGISPNYMESQLTEGILLTQAMINQPRQWPHHIKRAAASFIMGVVYDKPPIKDAEDPAVTKINDFVSRLTRSALPGAHYVEFMPWLRHAPAWAAKWKRRAIEWNKMDSKMFVGLFNEVRDKLDKGDERFSLTASLIKDSGRNNLSVSENAWLAGTMYAGGAETTAGVLTWFMLAMIAYPDTQRRAQAELDAIVGRTRIPTFADWDHLPYIGAMIKEILRWHPVDPIGLPHQSIEDDWYNGYFIPKGSICIANVWHLNRDPDIYGPDAHHFNPSRHLDEKGAPIPGIPDTKEENHVTYGFGRRLCVGRHVANQSLFIDIALMLWALNIENPVDANGKPAPIDVDGFIDDGLVMRPAPFEVKLSPRFPEAPMIIDHEKELKEWR